MVAVGTWRHSSHYLKNYEMNINVELDCYMKNYEMYVYVELTCYIWASRSYQQHQEASLIYFNLVSNTNTLTVTCCVVLTGGLCAMHTTNKKNA